MAAFNKFNAFVEALAKKQHNLATDVLKVMLTNTAPVATNSVKSDITEITAGNGYAAGGPTVAVTSAAQAAGTFSLIVTDVTIVASGGSIGPFRYAVVYNSTANLLIGWFDRGVATTLIDGDSAPIDFDTTNNVLLTLA